MTGTQEIQTTQSHWLTPARCRLLLIAYLLACAIANVIYLNRNCPIDLSGDEAQYWDWSRRLDLSYYSKGPLVAYLIRASCAVFGETMPAVRYPAIVLGAGTSIFAYLLTLKLFQSDRLALGAVLLTNLVPIMIFGQIFMTIDAPLFFCWAAATYFAAIGIFDQKSWAWICVGIFAGLGFLAKYAMFLWIPSLFLFLLMERGRANSLSPVLRGEGRGEGREARSGKQRWSRSNASNPSPQPSPRSTGEREKGAIIATLIALLFTIPVILWNHQHGWVSLKHVAHQTGTSGGSISRGNFFELIGSQIAVLDPILAGLMLVGIIHAIRSHENVEPHARQLRLLVWIGLPFFVLTALSSFLAKAQVNWPAPAYFTLLILAAYFVSIRWNATRGFMYAAIVVGIIAIPLARDPSLVFPVVRATNDHLPKKRQMNPGPMLSKIAGWQLLGESVGDQLSTMHRGAFVLCDDYMQTAETAFYVPGQPTTYCAGPYYLSDPKRLTQYDMWKDRSLEPLVYGAPNSLLGRDCIYVGKGGEIPPEIPAAFGRIEKLEPIPVIVRGFEVKTFKLWRCYGFKGMSRPSGQQTY